MAGVRQIDRTDTLTPGIPPNDVLHGVLYKNQLWQRIRERSKRRDVAYRELIISNGVASRNSRCLFSSISALVTRKC